MESEGLPAGPAPSSTVQLRGRAHSPGLQLPLKPKVVLEHYGHRLNSMEKVEIMTYQSIYYLDLESRNLQEPENLQGPEPLKSSSSEDPFGPVRIVVGGHISYRYEIMDTLYNSENSVVVRVFDHATEETKVIKILNFRAIRQEAIILQHIRSEDRNNSQNVLHLLDSFTFRSRMCLVFEFMEKSLRTLLTERTGSGFPIETIKDYATKILKGLEFIHRVGVTHCDLKPSNILVNTGEHFRTKLIDFGIACKIDGYRYPKIQTRNYRAPEVMFGLPYTQAADMWSFGCLVAELCMGRLLFNGDCETMLLKKFIRLLGLPPGCFLRHLDIYYICDENGQIISTVVDKEIIKPSSITLQEITNCQNGVLIDFMKKCLQWDPKKRMTSKDALMHPFLMK